MLKKYAALAAAAACVLAAPASAATFNLTLATNAAGAGTLQNGYYQSATIDGISFQAFAMTGKTATSLPYTYLSDTDYASLQRWVGGGLGIINSGDNGGANNQHTVDNVGQYDVVAFVFDKAVRLTGMTLNAYAVNGAADKDAWVSYATLPGELASLDAAGMTTLWNTMLTRGMNSNNGAMVDTAGKAGNVWLIGAARNAVAASGSTPAIDLGNDGFKIGSVSATAAVPEPATWGMMILGFGVAGSALRRRRTAVAFAA